MPYTMELFAFSIGKNLDKAMTQDITNPALMSSSIKVILRSSFKVPQENVKLKANANLHQMMHARDQSIFLYLGSIMVACMFEIFKANGIELDKLTDICTLYIYFNPAQGTITVLTIATSCG